MVTRFKCLNMWKIKLARQKSVSPTINKVLSYKKGGGGRDWVKQKKIRLKLKRANSANFHENKGNRRSILVTPFAGCRRNGRQVASDCREFGKQF